MENGRRRQQQTQIKERNFMADGNNDKVLNILIQFGLDDKQAREAITQINKVAEASKTVGTSLGHYQEAAEGAEKRIEGVSGSSREMYRIFYELDRLAPGLGETLRATFTGPLGAIGLLIFGVVGLKSALSEYDAELDKTLTTEDTGLEQAKALAVAYNGIATAVTKAASAWDSAQSIEDRGLKNIEAQLAATTALIDAEKQLAIQRLERAKAAGQIGEQDYEAQKAAIEGQSETTIQGVKQSSLQAQLGQMRTEVTNATIQAQNAQRKAEGFKIPATDEEAKANADAMKQRAEEFRKNAETARADAARYNDMAVSASTVPGFIASMFTSSSFWKGAWEQFKGNAPETMNPFGALSEQSKQKAKEATEAADSADKESARLSAQIAERNKARDEAARLAAEAAKIQEEFEWQNNPNNAAGIAAKILNERNVARVTSIGTGETQLTADFAKIQSDLAVHGPGAQAALMGARDALRDAVNTMASLSKIGDDVRRFRQQLTILQQQVAQGGYVNQQ
jgi:hypothetical protein